MLHASANGGAYTWSTNTPGIYNFACQVGNHCPDGMLVKVVVSTSYAPGPALPPQLSGVPDIAPSEDTDNEGEGDNEGSEGGMPGRKLLGGSW